MTRLTGWLAIVVLVIDAVLLAVYELLYLPLHLPRSLGGLALPVTVLAAAVTTPLLVWAAAKVAPRRGAAVAPLVAWLLTVLPLGIAGPGGDRVLPADWRALLLMAAGMLCGGVAVGRVVIRQGLPARAAEVEDGRPLVS
jgi:hypothetical protein